jgi:Rieske [2Fe-2S] domain
MDKVLCAVYSESKDFDEQEMWMDLDININFAKTYEIIPLIDHPHSDRENGQNELHYHIDSRYLGNQKSLKNYSLVNYDFRPLQKKYKFIYMMLQKNSDNFDFTTEAHFIKKSKLKHDCIYKGKCPHRGFDLSNIKPIDGVITCPLHSLKFDMVTKKIINLLKI